MDTAENKQEDVESAEGPNLADLLKKFEDGPNEAKIEEWKQQHGEVLCSGFSESEIIVWRPLTRREFVTLQTTVAQAETQMTNFDLEDQVVETCVLWASPTAKGALQQKAGSMTTLNEQIMQNSNFIDPRMASALVVKL